MREQLQEQERREAEQRARVRRPPPPAPALKVPIQSIGIDVPPQVLQVRNFNQDNGIISSVFMVVYL